MDKDISTLGLTALQIERRNQAGTASAPPVEGETVDAVGGEAHLSSIIPDHSDNPRGQTRAGNIVESQSADVTTTAHEAARMALVTGICDDIGDGMTMVDACAAYGVPKRTFMRWVFQDAQVAQAYTHALKMRAAFHAEELENDIQKLYAAEDQAEVSALKVAINTRQWIMSRLLPKQYGEKTQVEHTGEVKLDQKQVDARLQHLLGRIIESKG